MWLPFFVDGHAKKEEKEDETEKENKVTCGKNVVVNGDFEQVVDGKKQMSASGECVPEVARKQNFYIILSAQTHGKNEDYTMFISGVRAYVP